MSHVPAQLGDRTYLAGLWRLRDPAALERPAPPQPDPERAAAPVTDTFGGEELSSPLGCEEAPIELRRPVAAALADFAGGLERSDAARFVRAAEALCVRFEDRLGDAPERERRDATERALAQVRAVLEGIERPVHRGAALSAIADLAEQSCGVDLLEDVTAACAVVGRAISSWQSSPGLSEHLFTLAAITEAVERRCPKMETAERDAIRTTTIELIRASSARQPDAAGQLTRLVSQVEDRLGEGGSPLDVLEDLRAADAEPAARRLANARSKLSAFLEETLPSSPQRAGVVALCESLNAVLDLSGGDDAVVRQVTRLTSMLRQVIPGASGRAACSQLATFLAGVAGEPNAELLLTFVDSNTKRLLTGPEAVLEALLEAKTPAKLAEAMVASVGIRGLTATDRARLAEALAGLGASEALSVAIATCDSASHAPAHAIALWLADRCHSAKDVLPIAELRAGGDCIDRTFRSLTRGLGKRRLPTERSVAISIALVESLGPKAGRTSYDGAGLSVGTLLSLLSKVSPEDLMRVEVDGAPGLHQLLAPRVPAPGRDPVRQMSDVVQRLAEGQSLDAGAQLELARFAIRSALSTSHLEGGYNPILQRVNRTYSLAVAAPKRPLGAAAPDDGGLLSCPLGPSRAEAVLAFASAHPLLPPELAPAAALFLTRRQLEWVETRIARTRSRDTVRALRDFVFAAIEVDGLALIEAVVAAEVSDEMKMACVHHLAHQLRLGRLDDLPVEQMVRDLGEGLDPVARIERDRIEDALSRIDLEALAGADAKPEGLEELRVQSENVARLLDGLREDFLSDRMDAKAAERIFLRSLSDVVRGQWPDARYRSQIARRQLRSLSPAQKRAWKEALVTPGEVPGEAGAAQEAIALAQGLRVALPLELSIPFTPQSARRLRAEQERLVVRLRETGKGRGEHRALGARAREVTARLAAVELKLALDAALDDGGNARVALCLLRPAIEAAQGKLERLGAPGCHAAVRELSAATRLWGRDPREGHHAIDEDGFGPLISSHFSGCLNLNSGSRRWSHPATLRDANTRMMRVFRDGRQVYRGYLRVWPVLFEGYDGPALWIEAPRPDGGGTAEDAQLFVRHAVAKARAMGVPVMSSDLRAPIGKLLLEEAERQGLRAQAEVEATFEIVPGALEAYHSDNLLNRGYGAVKVKSQADEDGVWRPERKVTVLWSRP